MLNCWRVNESWIVDMTEFLIQKLSAAFAKSLLELVNVIIRNFIDFKIDSFKIRKNLWILGNFEIRKVEFSIYGVMSGWVACRHACLD